MTEIRKLTEAEQEAEIKKITEQAQEVRRQFGRMISDACNKLAKELDHDPDVSVFAFAIGVEWGAMTFAAACGRCHKETEESFMTLAEQVFAEKESWPEFTVSAKRENLN